MCFVWWHADGYGPLWLYGTTKYRKSCESAAGKGVSKKETIMIRSRDPKRPEDPDGLKEIRLRDVKRSVWEDKDLFPYPPPVECEWRYMARYYKLGHLSEACRELALKWATHMKIFSLENEAEASVKTMWAISGRSALECYRYLRRTESQLQKIRFAGDYELEWSRNYR